LAKPAKTLELMELLEGIKPSKGKVLPRSGEPPPPQGQREAQEKMKVMER
jgi:hypothetical protein